MLANMWVWIPESIEVSASDNRDINSFPEDRNAAMHAAYRYAFQDNGLLTKRIEVGG